MRWSGCRIFIGAAVLAFGIIGMGMALPDPAPVPDAEFTALVEQDAKNILTMLKNGKPEKKTADRAVKSNALMIAAYAQSRMGKNPADDAKLEALRDAAIQVAVAAGKKNYMGALAPAKTLSVNIAAQGKATGKKVDLLATISPDLEELMYQFKKTTVGGLGVEEEIKDNAKDKPKNPMKAAMAAAVAQRVLIVSDFCDNMEISGNFTPAKPKANWLRFNKDMKTAATELAAAAAKPNNAKGLSAAFTKLDASCVACHNVFK